MISGKTAPSLPWYQGNIYFARSIVTECQKQIIQMLAFTFETYLRLLSTLNYNSQSL